MNLYPDLWAKPVPNDSESFDLPRTMARGRENMVAMRASEVVPHATAEVGTRSSLPVLIAPGEICAFSGRSEEHTSELQSLLRISYAVLCLKKKKMKNNIE